MDHKNVVGREVGRIRSNRGWSQADLARELQKAGWDISRSEVSKIEMRIREVKDWQMMLLVHLLETSHESFYPRLDPRKDLRDALASTMTKKQNNLPCQVPSERNGRRLTQSNHIHRAAASEAAAAQTDRARNNTASPANTRARSSVRKAARNSGAGEAAAPLGHLVVQSAAPASNDDGG